MKGLKIAIPNKGRLSDDIFDLLQRAGLTVSKKERSLYATTADGNYTVMVLSELKIYPVLSMTALPI
ncbi:MAG: hypothetical protein MZV70_70125 [Desulfobacterales bacterium]|nr:hypothetical protein [Desulfobacterales bacterium]